MDYLKQMRIVARKYLGKYIVCACGEVAVNHFGYFFQTIHHFVKLGGIIQNEPYIGACLISYSGRVNYGFKPFYNAWGSQFLYTLMDGCSGNVGLSRYFEKRFTGIVR